MTCSESYDALVLAGGAGRRMQGSPGAHKAELEVGGIRLLDRVLAAVIGAERIVVVGPRRPTVRAVIWTIEDPAGSGPAAALVHGLPLLSAPIVVVLAADLPFAATVVPRLIDVLATHRDDEAALLVDGTGRRQPLIAAYRVEALTRQAAGTAGRAGTARDWAGASVASLIDGLAIAEVVAIGSEAFDCDTAQQLARARAIEAAGAA
jgi:molybdopterin-guanine dinucleotide biosynthesis protein A